MSGKQPPPSIVHHPAETQIGPTRSSTTMPFSATTFLEGLRTFVAANPASAANAYARAAVRLRLEGARNPEQKEQYQALATQLDQLAASRHQEATPPAGENSSEDGPIDDYYIVDPWEELAQKVALSKVRADGSLRDEFEAAAILEQLNTEQEEADTQPVRTTPASAKPGVTLFGSQALVQYGGSPGSGSYLAKNASVSGPVPAQTEAMVVRWEGKLQEAQTITITASRVDNATSGSTWPGANDPSGNPYIYRPYVHVLFGGAYGQPNEFYADVGRGCQFALAANYVYVSVGMKAVTSLAAFGAFSLGSMVLGANMGFNASYRQSLILYTLYADNIGAGQTFAAVIPQFAATIEAFSATTPANWDIRVVTVNGTVLFPSTNMATANSQRANAIALSGDAYKVLVRNNSGSPADAEISFGLLI